MQTIVIVILALAFLSGQLIRLNFAGVEFPLIDLLIPLVCVLGIFNLKKIPERLPLRFLMAFLFSMVGLLAIIFSPLRLSFAESLRDSLYNLRFIFIVLAGLLVYLGVFKGLKENVSKILILSTLVLSILGLLQFIFLPDLKFLSQYGWDPHYFRSVSTFLDPNFLGAFLVFSLVLIFVGSWKKSNKVLIIVFGIIFFALLTTFSRSAYLMFAVSTISAGFLLKSFKKTVLAVVLTLVLFLVFQIYVITVSEPRNIDRGSSAVSRLNTWQQGIDIFSRSPLLGVGFNNYKAALQKYNLGSADFVNTNGATTNDSSILFVMATTGIIGIFVYLLFLFLNLMAGLKSFANKNLYGLAVVSVLIGLLVNSVFNNSLFYPQILLGLVILLAMI